MLLILPNVQSIQASPPAGIAPSAPRFYFRAAAPNSDIGDMRRGRHPMPSSFRAPAPALDMPAEANHPHRTRWASPPPIQWLVENDEPPVQIQMPAVHAFRQEQKISWIVPARESPPASCVRQFLRHAVRAGGQIAIPTLLPLVDEVGGASTAIIDDKSHPGQFGEKSQACSATLPPKIAV